MSDVFEKINILELEPASDLGGVTNFILGIIRYLPKNEFQIHFAAPGNGAAHVAMEKEGAIGHHIVSDYGIFTLGQQAKILRTCLQDNQIAVVHAHTVRAGLLAIKAAQKTVVKVVFTAHGWRYKQLKNPFKRGVLFLIERYIVRHAHTVTYLTNKECEIGKKITPSGRHVIIPISLDLKEYDSPHEAVDQFTITMIGRIAYQKDPKTFIKTAALLKGSPIRFNWIGEGPLREEMQIMIEQYDLSKTVVLLGYMPHEAIIKALHMTDILFFTSHFEGLPIVLLEAMAARVPIVAAAVSGIPEIIIENENGFLFEEGNAVEAAQKITTLYNDQVKRMRFADNARTVIERDYTPVERCGHHFAKLYRTVYDTNY